MAVPIWKDYTITKPSIQSATFTIATGGVTIYSGKVYSRDAVNGGVSIRINDICADYLQNQLPNRPINYDNNGVPCVRFTVVVQPPVGLPSQEYVDFIPDWSYDRLRSISAVLSSDPIRKTFTRGQLLFVSYHITPATITYTNTDTTAHSNSVSRAVSQYWDGHFDNVLLLKDMVIEPGTLVINLGHSTFSGTKSITIAGQTYTLVDNCSRYALHYINSYAGWDSLCMTAGTIVDNYTRKSASHLIDNTYADSRETVNFANTYKQKFQLNTGWLESGEKMHHLLGSTCVYLQDIERQEMLPVTITDTSCEYKTFKGNGGKLINYTINCELAQGRKRL